MLWSAAFHCAIPTLFLRRLLCTHFRRRTTDEQVAFILKLCNYPHARSFVYELAIFDVLCAHAPASGGPGNTNVSVTCHRTDGSAFPLGPGLVLAPDQVQVTADTVSVMPRDDRVYLLHSDSGLPWIDAFVISSGGTRVTMLQTTVNRARREVVSSAVSTVIRLSQRLMMPDTNTRAAAMIKWSSVFVSPGVRGEELARTLGEVHFRGGGRPRVVAGWVEIGGLLGYAEVLVRVLIVWQMELKVADGLGNQDVLKHEDAEALAEEIDDDPEPGTELEEGLRGSESRTAYLD